MRALKSFHDDFALPPMTVNDRVDRRRPVTGRYIVPQEGKLETAAAEKPPRLKGRGKSETTPRNPDPTSGTVRTRASQLGLCSLHDLEHIVGMVGHHPERIAGPNQAEVELGSSAVPRYERFPICNHASGARLYIPPANYNKEGTGNLHPHFTLLWFFGELINY